MSTYGKFTLSIENSIKSSLLFLKKVCLLDETKSKMWTNYLTDENISLKFDAWQIFYYLSLHVYAKTIKCQ